MSYSTNYPILEFNKRLEQWGAVIEDWHDTDTSVGLNEGYVAYEVDGISYQLYFRSKDELKEYSNLKEVTDNSTIWSCCGAEVTGYYREVMMCPVCKEHL